ncbi:winged helix-turn-helix domain-containing protein [Streptomyces griseorubiginosus]|uniref:GntR family transcriptional regulator n=1 Tax=Streptomyces griseorubiginosus TaxID=67304 RepID=UPI002E805532|nr:winged helix-turn-helix domain-containing protein [Streptomyces griseorubiginosus]WUB45387.1 winged helix-turn-helix domain-containing protein [Streptomyces griseorubiginosus]WUB53905.1 winged helix-turn-helix domain-containing protein [Streptomyces griseorubiginosus]
MSAEISKDDPRPESEQAADILRQEILRGDIKPGAHVGSVRDLATRFKISGMTVQRALAILREDGLILTTSRGSYARDPEQAPEASGADAAVDLPQVLRQLEHLTSQVSDLRSRLEALEGRSVPGGA